jgi:hypothetical protein
MAAVRVLSRGSLVRLICPGVILPYRLSYVYMYFVLM